MHKNQKMALNRTINASSRTAKAAVPPAETLSQRSSDDRTERRTRLISKYTRLLGARVTWAYQWRDTKQPKEATSFGRSSYVGDDPGP